MIRDAISHYQRLSTPVWRAANTIESTARARPRRPFSVPRASNVDADRLRPYVVAAYAVVVVIATLQRGLAPHTYPVFPIFRASTMHLLTGHDLYAPYAEGDLFKYSPSFALLFAPFAVLPFALSLLLWNTLNAVMLWRALSRILPPAQATLALALLTPELLVAAQASQSNALVASLIIFAFLNIERDWSIRAAFVIAQGALTKIFPLAALSFGNFSRSRRRFAVAFLGSAGGLILLPLLFVSPANLLGEYRSWGVVEARDALARGESVMGLLSHWLPGPWPNWVVQAGGTAVLLLPLAVFGGARCDAGFRRLFLCSLLTYVVLFNPQAERPSYIIAAAGLAIWYVAGTRGIARTLVLALALSGFNVALAGLAAWLFMQSDLWRLGARTSSVTGRLATEVEEQVLA